MTECPLAHDAGFLRQKEQPINNLASRHAQLSLAGQRVLDRLLLLLPIHLKFQLMARYSPFPSALLYSICDALQLDCTDSSAERNDPSILPSVLRKLRDWRLLEPDYRYSPGGVLELALGLARITDEAFALNSSDLDAMPRARLFVKWVSSDSPSGSPDRESSLPTPPPPSSSLLPTLGVVRESLHSLQDLNGRRHDNESFRVVKPSTPDSEDVSAVASPRDHSVSRFRSGCSACRHLRLSGVITPPSPYMASAPFSSVNRYNMNISPSTPGSPRHPKLGVQHTTTKETKWAKVRSMQPVSRRAVDENVPPAPKLTSIPQGVTIWSPRQCKNSPGVSKTYSPREPFASVVASAQPRPEPSHFSNPARRGDKHISSQRIASVDLRLSMANPSASHASPSDHHPRERHFSSTPVKLNHAHGLRLDVSARVPTLSPNAPVSRSSKLLPSWSTTHLIRHPTTTTKTSSVAPPSSPLLPPAKARPGNPRLSPFIGAGSRPSSTSAPRHVPRDMKHRDDRRSVSSTSQTHAHVCVLPPSSPRIYARK